MALCHGNLSLVACRLGQIDEAHEHVLAALALYTELEDGWGVIRSLSYLGRIALAQNTMARPETVLAAALKQARAIRTPPLLLEPLIGVTDLLCHKGQYLEAALVLQYIMAHSTGNSLIAAESQSSACRHRVLCDARLA